MTSPLFFGALLLGLIQGLTEFIPVSSSGHLILADQLVDLERAIGGKANLVVFEVMIQLGSVMAILAEYGGGLARTARGLVSPTPDGRPRVLLVALVLGTLPAIVVGGLFGGFIQDQLFSPRVVAWSFIVGGVVMWVIESLPLRQNVTSVDAISPRQAVVVGLAQVLALIPGTSRSGATIMGALGAGLDRRTATEYSFLLALPVLLAAAVYTVVRNVDAVDQRLAAPLIVGFIASFFSSWLVIRWLLRFVRNHTFKGFAAYRIAFGIVLLVMLGSATP
jgi:undecaprenyl-diphosphatase